MQHESWYQGTADAVRRNIPYFTEDRYDLILILSGDQLYRMNFQEMIRTHLETKAEATIAALPVGEAEAKSCGIMRIDQTCRVTDFEEKPKTAEKLERVRTDPDWLERFGIKAQATAPTWPAWGFHLFNRATLVNAPRRRQRDRLRPRDLPASDGQPPRPDSPFDGYWEDIGTVGVPSTSGTST